MEELIPIFGIVFGTTLVMVVFSKIIGLIKFGIESRMKVKGGDGMVSKSEFEAVKRGLERRIQTLEAIVVDEKRDSVITIDEFEDEKAPEKLKNKLRSK